MKNNMKIAWKIIIFKNNSRGIVFNNNEKI